MDPPQLERTIISEFRESRYKSSFENRGHYPDTKKPGYCSRFNSQGYSPDSEKDILLEFSKARILFKSGNEHTSKCWIIKEMYPSFRSIVYFQVFEMNKPHPIVGN